ncbi:hypothetical protein MNBD_PLANCTO02-1221 [hydrothermal vent metagenome]|uniref:Bacterial membrane protein YfhO n=1 Tax=hydrothermal vent metagenome TaxID=652676 RepID=A0A3B1DLM8_9ZZZZ
MLQNKRSLLLALSVAIGLTFIFWFPLWSGGGFIGGDVYSYYLPQKVVYSQSLSEGVIPLWHPLTGHGYPMIAESQTGVLYPFNLLFYSTFDLNTAYNANHLLHYMMAFFFCFLFARKIGLGTFAALFAATIYTYGWFPSRSCLEWAIIGGTWLPLALWCIESFLQTRWWRYLIGLAIVIDLQLLAGHFNIAFLTLLLIAGYVLFRLWFLSQEEQEQQTNRDKRWKPLLAIGVALGFGFLLAAVQVLPTWELKHQSQRAELNKDFNPAYGHIPPLYFTQMTTSLLWYSPTTNTDKAIETLTAYRVNASTNKVEAHLYFGMIPFWMVVLFFIHSLLKRKQISRWQKMWLLFALLSMVYATGWLIPVTKYLPGFNFFQGPGRYSLITTLAVALLAGGIIDRWYKSVATTPSKKVILIGMLCLTVVDLWFVSRWVSYSLVTSTPIINFRDESPVRELLAKYKAEKGIPRMWAPGENLPNLTGFASTPTYLGLSPEAYYDPKLIMPKSPDVPKRQNKEKEKHLRQVTPQQIKWLQQAGVTHVLSFDEIDLTATPLQLKWMGGDRLLHNAWGRRSDEPIYLYELAGSRGRVSFASPQAGQKIQVQQENVNTVTIDVTTEKKGRLILTDLAYPGWKVLIDDKPAESLVVDGMFRGVDLPAGTHRVQWQFRPRSVWWGAIISLVTLLVLAGIAHIRFWYPDKYKFLEKQVIGY